MENIEHLETANHESEAAAQKLTKPARELTEGETNHIPNLLLLSDKPLKTEQIARILDPVNPPSAGSVEESLKQLRSRNLSELFPGMELVEVAQGWRYQITSADGAMIHRLYHEKPPRYSRAVMETLAIIAWRGPVTRGDIESIRGVAVSPLIVRTLMDREWVVVKGYRNTLGRPELLVTTDQFLDDFNLKSLDDLPAIEGLFEALQSGDQNPDELNDLKQGLSLFSTESTESDSAQASDGVSVDSGADIESGEAIKSGSDEETNTDLSADSESDLHLAPSIETDVQVDAGSDTGADASPGVDLDDDTDIDLSKQLIN